MRNFLDKLTRLHFFLDVAVLTLLLTLMLIDRDTMETYVRLYY